MLRYGLLRCDRWGEVLLYDGRGGVHVQQNMCVFENNCSGFFYLFSYHFSFWKNPCGVKCRRYSDNGRQQTSICECLRVIKKMNHRLVFLYYLRVALIVGSDRMGKRADLELFIILHVQKYKVRFSNNFLDFPRPED